MQMEQETTRRQRVAVGRPASGTPRRRNPAERGQALLEFAFMAPLLCLVLVGIIEVGRAARMSIVLTTAASAGAEFGAQSSSNASNTTGIQDAALCDANGANSLGICNSGILTSSNINVTYACRCDDGTGLSCELPLPANGTCNPQPSCETGVVVQCVQVTTHASFAPLVNWPGLPTSFQSNGNSVMRVRQ